MNNTYLAHHGILGQKWGVRRYQNADGSLTEVGKLRSRKLQDKALKQLEIAKKYEKKRDAEIVRYGTKATYYQRKAAANEFAALNSVTAKVIPGLKQSLLRKSAAQKVRAESYRSRIDRQQSRIDRGEAKARAYLRKAERFDSSINTTNIELGQWHADKLIEKYANEPVVIRNADGSTTSSTVGELTKSMKQK